MGDDNWSFGSAGDSDFDGGGKGGRRGKGKGTVFSACFSRPRRGRVFCSQVGVGMETATMEDSSSVVEGGEREVQEAAGKAGA
jgi:hypothetical protein